MYAIESVEKPRFYKVENWRISKLGGAKHMANCFYFIYYYFFLIFIFNSIVFANKQKFPTFSFRTLPPRTSVNCSYIGVFIKHSKLLENNLFCT